MSSFTRQLFGGAITVTLPQNLLDASDLRQVPDTQEVFLYPSSSISLIVEVLQRADPSDPKDAVKFHFEALAHDNSAQSQAVHEVTIIPNGRGDDTPSVILLSGTQTVPKFNRPTPDEVRILMALYRVESKNIDLVMSMNIPVTSADGGAADADKLASATKDFDVAAKSLHIVDFGLFA